MIKISHLNKIYKSKKRKQCHALKDINLTLPDSGLVFVLGKSGSGKSTLLNLIGGLDNVTSGSIEVDGNDLAKFRENDFCNYRNTHIGFIFQDYHLIDELTVYENIVLSLNLRRLEDKDDVKNALARVDLAGYEDRYPSELSGGEQQRVAIARAIVKKPRIILADEPTGNLDTNTAKAIVELLKELSKECLILIVSHNVNDANSYADRIIELKKGEIISDVTRNPDFADKVTLKDGNLVYPQGLTLCESDIDFINENTNKKFILKTDKFLPTNEPIKEAKKVKIENKSLSLGKKLKLSGRFLKNKTFAIALSSFMVAVIMVIMALAQTIIAFDAGKIIANEMDKMDTSSVYMLKMINSEKKAMLGDKAQDYFVEISDDDIQRFYDNGYTEKIYNIYNFFMPINGSGGSISAGWNTSFFTDTLYPRNILGVVEIDEEFLTDKFGEINYLAKVEEFHPGGIIITDYVADALFLYNVAYRGKSYEDLLGYYQWGTLHSPRGYINAVIKTDYKEKYGELFEGLDFAERVSLSEYMKDERFVSLINEVYSSYGLAYTFEKDFEESFENNYPCAICWHSKLYFDNKEFISTSNTQLRRDDWIDKELKANEVMMSYVKYNEIFGTNYKAGTINEFEPHTVRVRHYRYDDIENKSKLLEMDIVIAGLTTHDGSGSTVTMIASDEIYDAFVKDSTFVTGLYFNGNQNIDTVIDTANELGLTQYNSVAEGIYTMAQAVDVFIPIFELVAIFLCIGVIFILMNFASKMIKDKMHEIGIMKALGAKNSSVGVVFGLQVVLIALLTCILATVGYYYFIGLANDILVESLMRFNPQKMVLDLDFLTFKPLIAVENCILIFILALASLLLPMIKIKAIKPVKIIKAKE